MHSANIHAAKTHFSKWIELVIHGEEVVICKHGKPVALLTGFSKIKRPRKLGVWKGKVKIAKDFDDELPDNFMEHFK